MNDDEHETKEPSPENVGYGRPPVATRFQPGNKAAARRRSKTVSFADTLHRIMLEPRKVLLRGKQVQLPAFEVMIRRTMERAIEGDMRAVDRVVRYWDRFNFRPVNFQTDTRDYGAELRAKIEAMARRLEGEKAVNSGKTGTGNAGKEDGS